MPKIRRARPSRSLGTFFGVLETVHRSDGPRYEEYKLGETETAAERKKGTKCFAITNVFVPFARIYIPRLTSLLDATGVNDSGAEADR